MFTLHCGSNTCSDYADYKFGLLFLMVGQEGSEWRHPRLFPVGCCVSECYVELRLSSAGMFTCGAL